MTMIMTTTTMMMMIMMIIIIIISFLDSKRDTNFRVAGRIDLSKQPSTLPPRSSLTEGY